MFRECNFVRCLQRTTLDTCGASIFRQVRKVMFACIHLGAQRLEHFPRLRRHVRTPLQFFGDDRDGRQRRAEFVLRPPRMRRVGDSLESARHCRTPSPVVKRNRARLYGTRSHAGLLPGVVAPKNNGTPTLPNTAGTVHAATSRFIHSRSTIDRNSGFGNSAY